MPGGPWSFPAPSCRAGRFEGWALGRRGGWERVGVRAWCAGEAGVVGWRWQRRTECSNAPLSLALNPRWSGCSPRQRTSCAYSAWPPLQERSVFTAPPRESGDRALLTHDDVHMAARPPRHPHAPRQETYPLIWARRAQRRDGPRRDRLWLHRISGALPRVETRYVSRSARGARCGRACVRAVADVWAVAKAGTQVIIPYRDEDEKRHLKVMGDLGQIVPMVCARSSPRFAA